MNQINPVATITTNDVNNKEEVTMATTSNNLTTTNPTVSSPSASFTVSYLKKGTVVSRGYNSIDQASEDYAKIERLYKYPCVLEYTGIKPSIPLMAFRWTARDQQEKTIEQIRDEMVVRLEALGYKEYLERIQSDDISITEVSNAVAARNAEALAKMGFERPTRFIFAVKDICCFYEVKRSDAVTFSRITLNNYVRVGEPMWLVDHIRKAASPVEEEALALGGTDAIIHVVSAIRGLDETRDLDVIMRTEALVEEWNKTVDNGLKYNGHVYLPLGRGTNADKEVKSLWVKEDIYAPMLEYVEAEMDPNRLTTPGKDSAYKVGTSAVKTTPIPVPFVPEDIIVLKDLYGTVTVNVDHQKLDGTHEVRYGVELNLIRTDGCAWIDIEERQVPEFLNRFEAIGVRRKYAEIILRNFMARSDFSSIRCKNLPIKAGCDKNFRVHKYLRSIGCTQIQDAYGTWHKLEDKCIFITESALKTSIGVNGAYKSFEALCHAARRHSAAGTKFAIGELVREHALVKKNLSYQVLQALVEANDEQISAMAHDTASKLNGCHTPQGAAKLLPKELGFIAEHAPSIFAVENVKDQVDRKFIAEVDEAFGGKLLGQAYYTFDTSEPIWAFSRWAGKPSFMLEAGTFSCGAIDEGEYVHFRSPVANPNSVRVECNVRIPEEFKKFFKDIYGKTAYKNNFDDGDAARDEDNDGDHGQYSNFPELIAAAKATLAKWDKLITWDEPKKEKAKLTDAAVKAYWKDYIKPSNLGLVMTTQNKLLNGIKEIKKNGASEFIRVPIDMASINYNKKEANCAVDKNRQESISGILSSSAINPSEASKYMMQPLSKIYRDRVLLKPANVDSLDPEFRSELDALTGPVPEILRYKTLNKYYAMLCESVDRTLHIDGVEGPFDYTVLMYNKDKSRRGIKGLVAQGKTPLQTLNGITFRVDQGLFQYLADRIENDRRVRKESNENKAAMASEADFRQYERVQALSIINEFVGQFGKTIEDAYDVITWQMFEYSHAWFDDKTAFVHARLWQAYWMIFGGFAVAALKQNLGIEDDVETSENDVDEDE